MTSRIVSSSGAQVNFVTCLAVAPGSESLSQPSSLVLPLPSHSLSKASQSYQHPYRTQNKMATAQVCPVVGTTTTTLPPDHPAYDTSNPEARCPVTNAKVCCGRYGEHRSSFNINTTILQVSHHNTVIHSHPSSPTIPDDDTKMDAQLCPALKQVNTNDSITEATCPVVGPVSAMLPPSHPHLTEKEAGTVCPVTNATLSHHKDKVHEHPSVPEGR